MVFRQEFAMKHLSVAVGAFGPTALFVLLWSSGALFAKWGLVHASAFVFLALRYGLALGVLAVLALRTQRWLPQPGTRWQVALVGLLMIGAYSVCYLLALQHGLTPGVLATVMGVQPLLTLPVVERRFAALRLLGLATALAGLSLVVYDSLVLARFSASGVGFALAALVCMTAGAIGQKRIQQEPLRVLPLQNIVSLLLVLCLLPLQPARLEPAWGLAASLFGMGVVISVAATLLLYRLIQAGNLVNVTSLFYAVPAGTALLDYLVLGNRLAPLALAGMGAIVLGLVLVFRTPARQGRELRDSCIQRKE
jgi:drug/metabolite transporter (DMT)-like permease